MEPASRWQRLAAVLVDAMAVTVPFALGAAGDLALPVRIGGTAAALLLLLVQLVWLARRGQTLGKRLMGARIALNGTGDNGGFVVNVLKRGLVTGLLNMIPGFFVLDSLFIFRADRRCVHDMIAGTWVIKT